MIWFAVGVLSHVKVVDRALQDRQQLIKSTRKVTWSQLQMELGKSLMENNGEGCVQKTVVQRNHKGEVTVPDICPPLVKFKGQGHSFLAL